MKLDLLGEIWRVGWGEVRTHRMRSLVTILAVSASIFTVVVLGSFARSGTRSLTRGIEDVGGARLVAVLGRASERRQRGLGGGPLSFEDASAIRQRVEHVQRVATMVPLGTRLVRRGADPPQTADLVGGDQDLLPAFRMRLQAGRNLNSDDLQQRRPVVILGQQVCQAVFGDCARAVGQAVHIGRGLYRVIGVVAPIQRFGANMGFGWNVLALVPGTLMAGIPPAMLVLTDGAVHHPAVKTGIHRLLSARHRYADDFALFDFGQLMESFLAAFRTLEWLVALLAGIALLVAAFGIFNAQAASLRQRLVDSGIRLALGAPRKLLALQMLLEAAALAGAGSLLGAGLGLAVARTAGQLMASYHPGWTAVVAHDIAAAACLGALVVGCLAGLGPARRAARLQVVECLRARG